MLTPVKRQRGAVALQRRQRRCRRARSVAAPSARRRLVAAGDTRDGTAQRAGRCGRHALHLLQLRVEPIEAARGAPRRLRQGWLHHGSSTNQQPGRCAIPGAASRRCARARAPGLKLARPLARSVCAVAPDGGSASTGAGPGSGAAQRQRRPSLGSRRSSRRAASRPRNRADLRFSPAGCAASVKRARSRSVSVWYRRPSAAASAAAAPEQRLRGRCRRSLPAAARSGRCSRCIDRRRRRAGRRPTLTFADRLDLTSAWIALASRLIVLPGARPTGSGRRPVKASQRRLPPPCAPAAVPARRC